MDSSDRQPDAAAGLRDRLACDPNDDLNMFIVGRQVRVPLAAATVVSGGALCCYVLIRLASISLV